MKRALFLFLATWSGVTFAQQEQLIIQKGLQDRANSFGLTAADFGQIECTSSASSLAPGVKHVYVRQVFQGIPVVNGVGSITLKNEAIAHVTDRFADLPEGTVVLPQKDAVWALSQAAQHFFDRAKPDNELIQLSTSGWSRGVYMLVLETAEGVATTRIVKQ